MAPLEEGSSAFAAGRVAGALELYAQASERAPAQPQPRLNMGFARLYLWQLAAARQDLETSLTLRPLMADRDAVVRAHVPPVLALLDALEGQIARSRQRIDTLDRAAAPGLLSLAEAVLACREQRWTDARSMVRRTEVLALGGTVGALSRTLDSWSLAEMGGPHHHVDRVALFSEASPIELREAWPELFGFLERAPQA